LGLKAQLAYKAQLALAQWVVLGQPGPLARERQGQLESERKERLVLLAERFLLKLTFTLLRELSLGPNQQPQNKFCLNALLVAAAVAQD
jgi:hypothetical protein